MNELSVFVDESGNFGGYLPHDQYYVITMVFHNQENSIIDSAHKLDSSLSELGLKNHCIHSGPIIRKQEDYADMTVRERRTILDKMVVFIKNVNIRYKCFFIEKKHVEDSVESSGKLAKQIAEFIRENYDEFLSYDVVKIYYDNGQIQVTQMLSLVFNTLLNNVEFKKVKPSEYKLFQAADVFCTFYLLRLKLSERQMNNSEKKFFGDSKTLKKNYFRHLEKKQWK